jgi:hypothetical protein
VSPANRLAVLPHGHLVDLVTGEPGDPWWKVSTILDGAALTGFVSSAFLTPVDATPAPPLTPGSGRIAPVHLAEDSPSATRSVTTGRAFPIGEAGRPHRSSGPAAQRIAEQIAIVRYLDVERSTRYQPGGGSTFCNIYAYDYCYLNNVYLPRVWWTSRAIADLSAGVPVAVKYADTVNELNANALYDWLRDFGPSFGWTRVATLDEIQQAANQGGVGVICAQRVDLNRSGHITSVVPEDVPPLLAERSPAGIVKLPLQSQAGASNFCFSCGPGKWWAASKFRAFGFWTHA